MACLSILGSDLPVATWSVEEVGDRCGWVLLASQKAMLIYKKTSTLAVRHVFDPQVMATMAEVVIKEGAKALGHLAEEIASNLAGDWVKNVAEKVRNHLTDHSERLTGALAQSN